MARKLYPIGLQTFERIRVEDKFYIDKTEYVYRRHILMVLISS